MAGYHDERYYIHYTDSSGDSTLIHNFYYDTAVTKPDYKPRFDSIGLVINHFSSLMGRYPFWKEKYGHCLVNGTVGFSMEHQTMSTMNYYAMELIAHELGHQWWGDLVTHGSIRDLWLTEGFARYMEHIYLEKFGGPGAARAERAAVFANATLGYGSVIIGDTTNPYRVFSSSLTYDKGSAVLHMLRRLADNDSLFFAGLRSYRQQFANATAVTPDLQNVFENVYGRDLDTFFTQWLYLEGVPAIDGAWNKVGNTLIIRIDQHGTVPGSVSLFSAPLEILIQSPAGDSLVKVYMEAATHYYSFTWDKPVSGCVANPDVHLLCRTQPSLGMDASLSIPVATAAAVRIHPNPSADHWQVSGLPDHSRLRLTDLAGRAQWVSADVSGSEQIPAAGLPAGVYLLEIETGQQTTRHKLIRR